MNDIFLNLDEFIILSNEILIQIKKNIEYQYGFAKREDKIRILATELNKIIYKNLQGFNQNLREDLKIHLLEIFSKKGQTITYQTIVKYILELNISDDEKINNLCKWFKRSTKLIISRNEIKYIIKNPINNQNISECKQENIPNIFLKQLVLILAIIVFLFPFVFTFKNSTVARYNLDFKIFSEIVRIDNVEYSDILNEIIKNKSLEIKPGIPHYLLYEQIDIESLKKYLENRNSYLINEPYFSTIIKISKKYNLSPYLLFALTGQEQGFVPNNNKYKEKIANNPYNVFVSWERYNTNIEDSTEIACITIINRLKTRPYGIDPFLWLNEIYAEDKNWWKGFKSLFLTIKNYSEIIS